MQNILIVDYGMANLRSVQKAFEKMGHAAEISGDPNRLGEADKMDTGANNKRLDLDRPRVFSILPKRIATIASAPNIRP